MQSSLLRKAVASPFLRSLTSSRPLPCRTFFWSSKQAEVQISSPPESAPAQSIPTPQPSTIASQANASNSTQTSSTLEGAGEIVQPTGQYDLKFIDDMDLGCLGECVSPLDVGNMVQGGSTLGFSQIFRYFDSLWLYLSMDLNMGMTGGLLTLALIIRAACIPLQVYSQVNTIKSSLLHPDTMDMRTRMNDYARQGNRQAQMAENTKIHRLNRKHGVYNFFSMLNILQIPVHLAFLSVINRYAFNFDQHPEITTGGVLWFKDLSDPDPFSILPVSCGVLMWFTFLTLSPTTPQWLRNIRKYLTILPLLSIPIWSSLPAGFNLYWLTTTLSNLFINLIVRSIWFRKKMGIYGYLPGTKLARMNQITPETIIKPAKVYKSPPTIDKLKGSSMI